MTAAEPTRRTSMSEHALLALRRMIICGDLAPGERLYETRLCAILDVSRTPLRDALTHLSHEGLLEPAGSVGYRVRSFSLQDIADAIELRGAIEGVVARLAAERGADPQRLGDARAAVEDLDRLMAPGIKIDIDRYAEANARYHEALAWMGGSGVVAEQIGRMSRLPLASPSAFLHARAGAEDFTDSLRIAHAQHKVILAAIEAGEGSRAEAIAREHARVARDNLRRTLQQADGGQSPLPTLAQIAS